MRPRRDPGVVGQRLKSTTCYLHCLRARPAWLVPFSMGPLTRPKHTCSLPAHAFHPHSPETGHVRRTALRVTAVSHVQC